MKRFGMAIRTAGDPEISGALAAGIQAGTRAENRQHGNEAVRRVAMMRHTPEEWAQMTEDARVFYGGREVLPRWAERLLAGYALICWAISRAYKAQDRILTRRT